MEESTVTDYLTFVGLAILMYCGRRAKPRLQNPTLMLGDHRYNGRRDSK
jgi:hypothetical protein